ncbi:hypothetical protein JCM16303_005027 [Sporobolomyces ruberrimus]
MASTFAIQSIPHYKPKHSTSPTTSNGNSSQPNSLPRISSTSLARELPLTTDASQPRRFSSTGTSTGTVYPSVFEIPNPNKMSTSPTRTKGIDPLPATSRSLSQVQEEVHSSGLEKGMDRKRRRAIDDVEESSRGSDSRRSSSGSRGQSESNDRATPNATIRSSFSFPANPHPQPQSRPPTHATRRSISNIPSPPPRNTPSPRSAPPLHELDSDARHSPTSASKRARTNLGSLESLAATATDLLTSSSATSPTSRSDSTPPTTAATSISSLLGPLPEAQSREHQAAIESSRQLADEQRREIERRRVASGGGPSNEPLPGSIAAALGKLKAEGHSRPPRDDSSERRSDSQRFEKEAGQAREHGLAKRRGHRPPAVSTSSFPPSNSTVAITSARSYEEALRSAPPGIPSVLVGSPVEATWAARIAKEAGSKAGGITPTSNGSQVASSSSRRQSVATGSSGSGGNPYSSMRKEQSHRSSHSISSSHPRGHSHQPLSSALMSTSHSRDHQPHTRPNGNTLNPPHSTSSLADGPPHNSSAYPHPPSHSHPLSHSHSYDRPQGPGTRLPPLSSVHPRIPSGGPPHASTSTPSYYSAPSPYSNPHPYAPHSHPQPSSIPSPPPAPPSQAQSSQSSSSASSKTAFLSLFSTFFDSLQDSRVLTTTLENQISRASSLLSTLQQSELVLEQLATRTVDQRMSMLETSWRKDIESSTSALEKRLVQRLERLENVVFSSSSSSSSANKSMGGYSNSRQGGGIVGGVGLGISDRPYEMRTGQGGTAAVEERLEKLERMLEMDRYRFSERRGQGDDRMVDEEEEEERRGGSGSLPTPHEENGDRSYGSASKFSSTTKGPIVPTRNVEVVREISRGAVRGFDEK